MKKKSLLILLIFFIYLIAGCSKSLDYSKNILSTSNMKSTRSVENTATKEDKNSTPTNVQRYSIYSEFPDDMVYTSKESFELIKEYYNKIDFGGEYKKGNIEDYDLYRNKFAELLINKSIIYDKDGKEFHLENFFGLEDFVNTKIYFFDFDEDNTPEFCTANIYGTYIIKYLQDEDQYRLLWGKRYSGGDIFGTRKIGYSFDGADSFLYQLDTEGNVQYIISFVMNYKEDTMYMVSLPNYADSSTDMELLKSMNQVYFSESNETYYIRVTKEQMNDLHIAYYEASISGVQERVDLSYFMDIN